jgi:hypothetical protein
MIRRERIPACAAMYFAAIGSDRWLPVSESARLSAHSSTVSAMGMLIRVITVGKTAANCGNIQAEKTISATTATTPRQACWSTESFASRAGSGSPGGRDAMRVSMA